MSGFSSICFQLFLRKTRQFLASQRLSCSRFRSPTPCSSPVPKALAPKPITLLFPLFFGKMANASDSCKNRTFSEEISPGKPKKTGLEGPSLESLVGQGVLQKDLLPPAELHLHSNPAHPGVNFLSSVMIARNKNSDNRQSKRKSLIRQMSSIPYAGRNSSMAQFDCLEKPLSIFFYKYGRFVSRHPTVFIVFPALITAALALGFLRVPENEVTDATYLFTPVGAPSKYEREVIHEKWPIHDTNFIPGRAVTQARECQLIIKSRKSANILRGEYAEAVDRLNKFILHRISVEYGGRRWTYEDLCLRWRDDGCHDNSHVPIIADLFNSRINISFPSFRFGSHRIYLASSMGGVTLRRGAKEESLEIVSAEAWMLLYQLKFKPDNMSYISGLWEREYERQLLDYRDPYIELTFFHSQTLTEELKRNAEQLIPRFAVSFTILVIFAVLCSMTLIRGRVVADWVVSKPVLAAGGVLNAGMAVVSAIGLLNYLKMPFNDIVLVMPFMAVAIGVDNMFLMVAAMRRTNRSHAVERRVGESLSDSAISISITALTDALSFGVGAITTIPAVQIFCVYTCVAILLTFLYQLTFFLGFLVIHARMEEKNRHCLFYARTISPAAADDLGWNTRFWMLGSRRETGGASEGEGNFNNSLPNVFFRDWFAPVLMNPVVKVMVILWLCVYLGFAVWGCTLLREGLEPINLLVRDSYAIPHYHALEDYFWRYGQQVQVVVNRSPDLSDPEKRLEVESMVRAFSNTPHTIGMEGTEFWMEEFKHFVEQEISLPPSTLNTAFYRLVNHFLNTHTYDRWSADVYWDPDSTEDPRIKSFRFMVGMRDFETTNNQRETTELLREVAERYGHFNVTTFMPIWLFTDQYKLILPNTVQNILIALACMLVIALLLIPQPLCALWVAVSIASIDVGVVGYMTLWDVNLDAISMITIIMSIGFSVDFSAHISYGYVISDEESPSERVRMALGALGWPIVQGALSTIFGVIVLSTVEAYMIVTFFKTVFLVITIGAIHGLIFLPVLLSIFVRGTCVGGPKKGKVRPAEKVVAGGGGNRVGTESPATSEETVDVHPYSPTGRYGISMAKGARKPNEVWVHPSNSTAHFHNGAVPLDFPPLPFNHSHPSQIRLVPSQASNPKNPHQGGGNPVFFVPVGGGVRVLSPEQEVLAQQYQSPPSQERLYRQMRHNSQEKNRNRRFSVMEDGVQVSPSRGAHPPEASRRHSSYEFGSPPAKMPEYIPRMGTQIPSTTHKLAEPKF